MYQDEGIQNYQNIYPLYSFNTSNRVWEKIKVNDESLLYRSKFGCSQIHDKLYVCGGLSKSPDGEFIFHPINNLIVVDLTSKSGQLFTKQGKILANPTIVATN